MGPSKRNSKRPSKRSIHFSLLIFLASMLLTTALWDAYFNGSRPLDRELASVLILIMGTLFSVSAGLFSWSLESRHDVLEREVERRTHELFEKNQELQQKKDEIENFIHIISHDLKAPIVSIQGFASILKDELGASLQGTSSDYFNRIVANTKQMSMLIADLLEFSRVGRVEDEKEVIDPQAVIQEILASLRPEIEKRNIKVEAADHFPKLWGSKKRFGQVLTNLITNAMKYMGERPDSRIEIGVSHAEANGFYTLWVKDNGIGIKKEYHEKIFQVFQRAPNQLKVEGTGIGLSIVKKVVELNGGKVTVESEEGKGSQFFIQWPALRDGALAVESGAQFAGIGKMR